MEDNKNEFVPKHYSIWSDIWFFVKFYRREEPAVLVLCAFEILFGAVLPLLGIWLPKLTIDLVEQGVAIPRAVAMLGGFVLLMMVVNGISQAVSGGKYHLYNTQRTNMQYDDSGVEISGGEAQKIAIARAVYKDAPFILLDEPTAALDPLAEYEIYSNFDKITGVKTAVYISHRLSSCRFCEKIAVFHEGRLVQLGRHEDLVADKGGKYYEMWEAQAQYYREKGIKLAGV